MRSNTYNYSTSTYYDMRGAIADINEFIHNVDRTTNDIETLRRTRELIATNYKMRNNFVKNLFMKRKK